MTVISPARFELLTPPGRGGVAVIEVVGEQRFAAVSAMLRGRDGRRLDALPSQPRLCSLQLGDEVVDQVLLVDRPQQGRLELHLHGAPLVVQHLSSQVESWHASEPPDPAVALLRRAQNEAQVALALEQRGDGLPGLLQRCADDPVGHQGDLQAAMERTPRALALSLPMPLVLCGRPNAGKSSLMNRLLMADRVLTGGTPGLTRDPVRSQVTFGAYPYTLIDTAGIHAAQDSLDQAAQQQAALERAGAGSILLLVVDAAAGLHPVDLDLVAEARAQSRSLLFVRNKTDLSLTRPWPSDARPYVEVSCLDPARAADVRRLVGEALRCLRGLPANPPGPVGGPAALTRQQHLDLHHAAS